LRGLPIKYRITELIRILNNFLVRYDPLVRLTARKASIVLTVTPSSSEKLPASTYGKTKVMQNIGLDLPEFPTHDLEHQKQHMRLLFVGRLLYWKGVDLALEAVQLLAEQLPSLTITVVGDGPDQQRLQTLTSRLGISDRVEFLGNIDRLNLLQRFASYDVFVFPSLHDSGGFAVLEAMVAKLPVVCLNIGGPGITVTDTCGCRISVDGQQRAEVVSDIAEAIRTLVTDHEIRAAKGEAGHRRVVNHYLWDLKGEMIRDLYAELAGGHHDRHA
jgi:glycosyltransferase involved in cell wall biosynthesis